MLSPIRSACSCLWLRLQHPWRLGPPQLFVCLVTYITHHIASLAGSATHMVAVPTPALLAGAAKFLTTSQRFPHLPPGRASFVQARQLCTSAPRSNQGALPLRCQHQPRRRPCLSHTAKLPSRHQHWYTHKSTRQIVPTWPLVFAVKIVLPARRSFFQDCNHAIPWLRLSTCSCHIASHATSFSQRSLK